ncbi:MAG: bifunctional folylpolyglutamate synthase/dihydrofolate synthase [Hyphomicrobiales bacterium]|nr:MAG: bifunctional folylpolyglutamate synthase/dihydrofolate synthase [Hyphomicrobiales bacterium]
MTEASTILERLAALHPKKIDLSLDRMYRVLAALDHPERRLPPVIHLAGTNGKGSTTANLRAILEAAGRSVHVYTSPHLVRFNERIRLGAPDGGRFVSDEALSAALAHVEKVNAGVPVTIFEITTAAAFHLFAENPADVLLLETGLGGRLDATNVVDTPLASVITSISLDHEMYLGTTLAEIAGEKAGIIKKGVPVITAPQHGVVADVLDAAAARLDAPIFAGGEAWSVHEEHGRLVYQDEDGLLDLPAPRLLGGHQYINTGLAVAVLRATGLAPDATIIEEGLNDVDWPARLQRLTSGTLFELAPKGADLWLDGGHNPAAGQAVATVMADLEDRSPRPLVLIAGMLTTKDNAGFLKPFAGLARQVMTVPISGVEASLGAEELAEAARSAGLPAEAFASVEDALMTLSSEPFDKPPRILICGSLYLAGTVLADNETPPE